MGNDIKACMSAPLLLRDFKNKKGYQYDIPYEKHSLFFEDVVDSIKNQTPLPFERNISFKKIVAVIEDSSKKPPLSAAPNSYLQTVLQEEKLKTALFISSEESLKILEQIKKRSWDIKSFNMWNVDLNIWFQSLQTIIFDRDTFLKQIERNRQEKKYRI